MPDRSLPKNPIFKRTERQASETAEQINSEPAKRYKATFYLDIEDIEAIDDLQAAEMRRTGRKPEKSRIVSKAIKTYRQQASKTDSQLDC